MKCGDGHKLIHRLVVEADLDEPLSTEQLVLHRCDNPPCYRRSHLYVSDHADNMRDLALAGNLRGERNGKSKLTDDQVREIRRLYDEVGWTQKHIGAAFGIHQVQVSAIVRRVAWAHVN